jgi:hypothetical protein
MRTHWAAALALTALTGCGESDETARNAFRQGSIDSCLEASRGTPAPPGFDWQRMCTCATERVMAGKTGAELAELQPGTPEQRRIVAQCAAEQTGRTKAGR